MTTLKRRGHPAGVLALSAALVLAACAGSPDPAPEATTPLGSVQAGQSAAASGVARWSLALGADGELVVSATGAHGEILSVIRVRNGTTADGTAVHDIVDASGTLELTEDGRVLSNTVSQGTLALLRDLNNDLNAAITVNLVTRGCLLVSASYTTAIAVAVNECVPFGKSQTCITASAQVAAPSIELQNQCAPAAATSGHD